FFDFIFVLVKEECHTIFLIFCLEAASEQLLLNHDRFVHSNFQTFVDSLLACANGNRSVLCDAFCHLDSLRHKLFQWIYLIYKADSVSLSSLDVAGSVDQLFCLAWSNDTSQSLCSAKSRSDSQTNFRLTEYSVLRAKSDITAHGDLAAAA